MFYSETLLSKTGPLARVWLAANLERKVLKKDVLQSNIQSSVHAIVDQGQAPLALRLSGQLLLGVVRIYSRKARYLLDDCNEAILKIKMAFRPGNVDLPANQSHIANPASLTLPDVLTELDLLAPMPDPSLLLGDALGEFDSSQRLLSTLDRGSRASSLAPQGLDDSTFEQEFATPRSRRERDVELGRDAPPSMSRLDNFDDTLRPGEGEDLDLDFGDPDAPLAADTSVLPPPELDDGGLPPLPEDDVDMGGMDTMTHDPEPPTAVPELEVDRQRESLSPLSSVRPSVERELDRTFNSDKDNTTLFQPDPEDLDDTIQQAQRPKRRKVIQPDEDIELHSAQIRALQNDRSSILRPASFLPKDPVLLALMEMQRKGGLASSILGDGMSKGWAPQLRGILSLEVVRQAGQKRRRDGTSASQQRAESSEVEEPRIEYGADTSLSVPPGNFDLEDTVAESQTEAGQQAVESGSQQGEADDDLAHLPDIEEVEDQTFGFDRTEAPLLHPNETGPVSLGTKHAVHLLREKFGSEAEVDAGQRQHTSLLFQDLLPEQNTTRAEATKMFFEILVLATKDAIKVEQPSDELGGPLRVRARRGLWGAWAESEVEAERGAQEAGQQTQPEAVSV